MTGPTENYFKQREESKKKITALRKKFEKLFFESTKGYDPHIKDYLCVIIMQNQRIINHFEGEKK